MDELKPIKNLKKPQYPDKETSKKDPKLLQKLPQRWINSKKAAIAAGLLASMTISFTACTAGLPTAGIPVPPKMVTESDAMAMVKSMSGGYFANADSIDAKEIKKPVLYLRYDAESKSLNQSEPAEQSIKIDLYNNEKFIGLEYLADEYKSENETTEFLQANTLAHADKENAYVLVMDEAYKDAEKENAVIKEQVQAFINWLKAENII